MDTSLSINPAAAVPQARVLSFIDRIMDFFTRLPVPYWLAYLILFLLQSVLSLTIAWIDGWLPAYTFNPIVLLLPFWLWGPLAMMTYLDSLALHALASVRSLLQISDSELEDLQREYTIMPPRNVLISSLIWIVVYFILVYLARDTFFVQYHLSIPYTVFIIITGLISYAVGSAIYYHSLRQLRLVHRTVRLIQHINLFNLDPYYAFSKVTAQTGISWLILLSVTLLTFPLQIAIAPTLMLLFLQVGLSLAAFALPLWVVHQRLVAEKRRLLAELDQRTETLLSRLHNHLDKLELEGIELLNNGMSALQAEREVLNRIPTWPWRAGMLTGFLSAMVLPIVLFVLQLIVGRMLGE